MNRRLLLLGGFAGFVALMTRLVGAEPARARHTRCYAC
jgi:hypothetical protein